MKLLSKKMRSWLINRDNQEGITIVEISVGLAILAFLAIFLAPRVGGLLSKTRVELGQQEIIALVTAVQQYRQAEGGYEGVSFAALDTGGYHIEPFSNENKENTYGTDIGLSGTKGSATMVYTTDADEDCKQLENRVKNLNPVEATCSGAVLTVIVN